MEDAPSPPSLAHPDAASWNRDIMADFEAVLERDPTADLMSMFSDPYRRSHYTAQSSRLSYGAQINFEMLSELYDELSCNPEINLLTVIPPNYKRRITMATGPKVKTPAEKEAAERNAPDFRTRLDPVDNATIAYPLSEKVTAALARYSEGQPNGDSGDPEKLLAASLKQLIWDSPKLWELSIRGVVVKCNEEIVAKVIKGNSDYTEYTSMIYLEKRAPERPIPRPHGLVALGPFRVIFMTYIPGTTLTKAWPCLTHEQKLSIQSQLNSFFSRLGTIRQDCGGGNLLGGVSAKVSRSLMSMSVLYSKASLHPSNTAIYNFPPTIVEAISTLNYFAHYLTLINPVRWMNPFSLMVMLERTISW